MKTISEHFSSFIAAFLMFSLSISPAYATTVTFNNGLKLEGEILEESAKTIKFKTGAETHYFQFSDIKRIEGTGKDYNSKIQNSIVKEQKPVEIFVAPWCHYCVKLEKFLDSNDIKYTKYFIETNFEGKKKYQKLKGTGVPVVTVGDEVIYGYNPEKILKMLGEDFKDSVIEDATTGQSEITLD